MDTVHRGETISVHGNGFSGIARIAFLQILHRRCRDLGVDLRFRAPVNEVKEVDDGDLLLGADGANSLVRRAFAERFLPSVDLRPNRYVWLGTRRRFEGLTMIFRESAAGLFIAHAYRFRPALSTFIVECGPETWRRAGFEGMSDAETCAYLADVFAGDLGGQPLLSNNFLRWLNFPLVKTRRWHHGHAVLVGDAAHTAHFSIGSGTKLALEDAIALARALGEHGAVGPGAAPPTSASASPPSMRSRKRPWPRSPGSRASNPSSTCPPCPSPTGSRRGVGAWASPACVSAIPPSPSASSSGAGAGGARRTAPSRRSSSTCSTSPPMLIWPRPCPTARRR